MNPLFNKVKADVRANDARASGIYPYFHRLESRQDAVVVMEGRRRIMLGSNNYLGLTSCPEVVESAIKAIEKYGTGCSGSRFLNGNLDLHVELERELASFTGKEDAIVFGTGFQTNLGVISAIAGRGGFKSLDNECRITVQFGSKRGSMISAPPDYRAVSSGKWLEATAEYWASMGF